MKYMLLIYQNPQNWQALGEAERTKVMEEAGAIVLFFGNAWGLYIVGLGMMSSFIFMVTGAWLLLVGVGAMETAAARD